MKEIYESPELNLISYVPAENLSTIDFGGLVGGNGGGVETPPDSGDFGIDF